MSISETVIGQNKERGTEIVRISNGILGKDYTVEQILSTDSQGVVIERSVAWPEVPRSMVGKSGRKRFGRSGPHKFPDFDRYGLTRGSQMAIFG